MSRAYPRSRGATDFVHFPGKALRGLSPLARGNLPQHRQRAASAGPIPARAGQPPWRATRKRPRAAYPRSRGATSGRSKLTARLKGLSPLARGNRAARQQPVFRDGPIPARAGQPRLSLFLPFAPGAYPRSRGATGPRGLPGLDVEGLSPLARGNLQKVVAAAAGVRPIPARAGQPVWRVGLVASVGAYPRSRGATFQAPRWYERIKGLSPLARGNLLYSTCCHTRENCKYDFKF